MGKSVFYVSMSSSIFFFLIIFYWRQFYHCTWRPLLWPIWLKIHPLGSFFFSPNQDPWLQVYISICSFSHTFWRSELRSPCFHNKHVTLSFLQSRTPLIYLLLLCNFCLSVQPGRGIIEWVYQVIHGMKCLGPVFKVDVDTSVSRLQMYPQGCYPK